MTTGGKRGRELATHGVGTRVKSCVSEAGVGVGVGIEELTLMHGALRDCGQKLLHSSLLLAWSWLISLSMNF